MRVLRERSVLRCIAMLSVALEAGRDDAPRFWIASTRGFAITNKPTDVGRAWL